MIFVAYFVLLHLGFEPDIVKTFIFSAFGTNSLFLAFSVKSLEKSIFSYSLFSNKHLTSATVFSLVLMMVAIYTHGLQTLFDTVALPLNWMMGIVLINVLNVDLIEAAKWMFRRFKNK